MFGPSYNLTHWKVFAILSNMESNKSSLEPEEQLAEVERLQTLPWTEYPPTPLWYFPTIGVWFALTLGCMVKVWDSAIWIAPLIGLVALEGAFIGWMTKRRGAMPRLGSMPAELALTARWYAGGVAIVVGGGLALMAWVSLPIGAAMVFLASTVGLYVYEQQYERAAEATRIRVGTT